MPRIGLSARALGPFLLYALARQLDAALGALLHTTLDLPGLAGRALGLVEATELAMSLLTGAAVGGSVWLGLAAVRRLAEGRSFAAALREEAETFTPLYIKPALSLLALLSVAVRPTFPYGATLPVALTQDWSAATDLAILTGILAARVRLGVRTGHREVFRRLPAPGAGSLFLAMLLLYALAVPERARQVDGHPGNEPKYLRMGVALGHSLSLDVEGIEGPMEAQPVEPIGRAAARAAGLVGRESLAMLSGLARGLDALDLADIRAERVARQTITGKAGGIYHVLAPGPSLLLAPLLRADRELNLQLGTPGRLRLSLLGWNAVAAGLVVAVFLLVRDATGAPRLAALLAAAFAVLPPQLFYFYQFYPEMPGALLIALALRQVFSGRRWTVVEMAGLGATLAALPWLHQKFLPVWGLLVLLGAIRAVDRLVSLRTVAALVAPQLVTLYAVALYNFAITGSARPDATFRAWGPGGITSAHLGQGLFGLLFDIHYGIVPWAPVYLVSLAGLLLARGRAGPLRAALPVVGTYYLTVAAADDWHGAVSHLGRYVMPATPWAIALIGVALARLTSRRGALAVVLALGAWSALLARAMWLDPHSADNALRLAERSAFADVRLYLPDLLIETMSGGAPGLWARLAAWAVLAPTLAVWMARAASGRGGANPARALAGFAAAALLASLALERWPSPHRLPRFRNAVELRAGTTAFVTRGGRVEEVGSRVIAPGGRLELLVRSRRPLAAIQALAGGQGFAGPPGRPLLPIRDSGRWLELPLEPVTALEGRRGVRERLYRARLRMQTDGPVAVHLAIDDRVPRRK